jgi:hypothetical protein
VARESAGANRANAQKGHAHGHFGKGTSLPQSPSLAAFLALEDKRAVQEHKRFSAIAYGRSRSSVACHPGGKPVRTMLRQALKSAQ